MAQNNPGQIQVSTLSYQRTVLTGKAGRRMRKKVGEMKTIRNEGTERMLSLVEEKKRRWWNG